MSLILILLRLFAWACLPAAPAVARDPVLDAMSAELERSFARLRHAEKAPLYHMEYEVTDSREYQVSASEGGLVWEYGPDHERYLDADLRVGSRRLDSTHQIKGPADSEWQSFRPERKVRIPIEDDPAALRAALWAETDAAFKSAQERFTRVLTNHAVTADEEDPSDDFSAAEKPAEFFGGVEPPPLDIPRLRDRVRRLSERFKGRPFIYSSNVSFSMRSENRSVATSEGRRIRTGMNFVRLAFSLNTRTEDGMELSRSKAYDGRTAEDLPGDETILSDIARSIGELEALKNAPVVQPYSGPVILKNRAAAVYFHELLGHRMERQRQKIESEGQTFARKAGQKIVSDFISVFDDPTLERFQGIFLRGAYRFDDQGTPASRVTLVENGVLKNFLMDRSPLMSFKESNGHGRREPGYQVAARQGNLIVEASKTVPYPELRRRLVSEIRRQGKPFGLLFEDIHGGFTVTNREGAQAFKVLPLLVYRVFADGRPDEPVRGVNIVGTPLTSFSKIEAAADDYDVFDGTCGAESGWVPVSAVAPSLLVSEMEVEKQQKSESKPPILPPPL